MEFWEFLLQKEGDRSWLPLESPSVEILEGRYRIVARSSRPNATIEIRVTQQDLYETPPVRRIQKRSSKTNPQGLVVIMPFTRLQPGDWELRCASDLMDEMMGDGWNQSLQLQVLPVDTDWTEDPLTGAEGVEVYSDETSPEAITQTADLEIPELPIETPTPEVEAPVVAVISEIATPEVAIPEIESPEIESLAISDPETLEVIPSLRLQLTQESWVMQRSQPLTLTGTIEADIEAITPPVQLRVRLFNPQNSQMLFDQDYPVQFGQPLPCSFACELSLAADDHLYLVLGELALYGVAQAGDLPPVLASQSFSITSELHELLEAIANDFPAAASAPPPPKPSPLAGVDLSFFNLPPIHQTLLEFQSPESSSVPPQPQPDDSTRVNHLNLPSFNLSEPYVPPKERMELEQAAIERPNTAPVPPVPAEPIAPSQTLELVDDLTADWDEDWDIAADGTLSQQQSQDFAPPSVEDRAFRSLNLQDRFLNRLQSLATDNDQLSDWLRDEPEPKPHYAPIEQEIVVDDDLEIAPSQLVNQAQPVAIPRIEVPAGELIADQPIEIWVKLPKTATRTYAKLWVRDRQTRAILDGPRWLIDMKPDGFGALRAQATVILPPGCMDVQFEAIAIEMTHQSESPKATVSRSVLPPEFSALSLEELDV
jgi:hypothetical protein